MDSGSVTYRSFKERVFWEEGVDYGSIAHSGGRGGRFWREG